MRIEKLTKEQIARFPEFVKKWNDIGLSTKPANRPLAEKGIRDAYKIAGLDAPKIVWCGSPLSQGLTRAIVFGLKPAEISASVWDSVRASVGGSVWASVGASVRDSVGASVRDSVWDSVRDSVRGSVWASVGASVRASVWASVWDSVWASVGASVRDSVWASVWDSVRGSVRDSVWASVWDSVGASVRDSVYGQHDAGWLSFYDYFRIACELGQETEKLTGIFEISKNAGWWLPHAKTCWISERHNILNRNSQGRLHCDGAPAVEYPDGWQIFALNGVRVKEEYAVTPAEKIAPKTVLQETNAEVRRELLRKIGIERFLSVAKHKVMHKQGDYELLSIELSAEIRDARYLKMINQSIGCWHVEGVNPDCKTVQEAINFRAGNLISKTENWNPEVLT